ncbi:hypothetical protein NW768_008662 [Fusarium equiseti]|uniref:Alpha/beta hydrolase fold-3 domain-containing protein n=1 Tax=Fusarium equiseti TaxID=61235 RepID=A0ABQ8R4X2_FUSEQ|nr:hypothetical protein NW768_008662 [Fusarium equiseti]
MSTSQNPEEVFNSYNIIQETFKTIGSHEIQTAILVPKSLVPGYCHPFIYHLHGGYLVTGHALFAPFFDKWVHKLALENDAIIVSSNYRLLPSSDGMGDVLEDVADGWQWTKTELPKVMEKKFPRIELDFNQILLAGSEAGGYYAIHLNIFYPEDFDCLALVSPLIDIYDRPFENGPGPGEPNVLDWPYKLMPNPENTQSWIEEASQTPVTRAGFERMPFFVAACQHMMFTPRLVDPNRRYRRRELRLLDLVRVGNNLAKSIWIMQGQDDSFISIRASDEFVRLVGKRPDTTVRYDVIPGQGHGFDFDDAIWESDQAVEALEFVTQAWGFDSDLEQDD